MLSLQIALQASDLVENGVIDEKVMNGEQSPAAIAKEISLAVVQRALVITKKHQPDLLHVFTHVGDVVEQEGEDGIFKKGRMGARGLLLSSVEDRSSWPLHVRPSCCTDCYRARLRSL